MDGYFVRAHARGVKHMKQEFIDFYGAFGLGASIGALALYGFIKIFLPSYLSQKGKNLATKEDIEEITSKVESVKSDYAKLLEEVRSEHRLKFAAVEREKSIRKEVYLDAAEAITRTQNIISNFTNLDIATEQITASLAEDAGKIAKVQIVATSETVKAVTKFMAEVGTVTLDLILKRSKILAELDDLNLRENSDSESYEVLGPLWTDFDQKRLVYTKECMDRFFEISQLLPPVILSVRKELELEISEEDYLNIFNENIQVGKSVFDRFLKKVQENA